jgi:hypothetical protein
MKSIKKIVAKTDILFSNFDGYYYYGTIILGCVVLGPLFIIWIARSAAKLAARPISPRARSVDATLDKVA